MTTLAQLLQSAEDTEEAAGRIYDLLASRFQNEAQWHPLFKRLASEEREHASRIQRLRNLLDVTTLSQDDHGLPSARIEELLALAKDIEKMLREDTRRLSLRAAVAATYRLEDKMTAVHSEVIAAKILPDLQELFEGLAQEDEGHAELFNGTLP